jgi:hypothetical protein
MKKHQILALFLSVAAFLSLLGTGFAIWYNVDVPTVEIEGDEDNPAKINAFAVDRSSDYIALKGTQPITVFQYSALSFTDSNSNPADTGTITVNYTLNAKDSLERYGDASNKVLLTLTLTHENTLTLMHENTPYNAPLFAAANGDGEKKSVTAAVTVNGAEVVHNHEPDENASTDDKLVFTVELDLSSYAASTATDVVVTYTFEIPKNYDSNANGSHKDAEDKVGNFRNVFGQYLLAFNDKTTTFVTAAAIS